LAGEVVRGRIGGQEMGDDRGSNFAISGGVFNQDMPNRAATVAGGGGNGKAKANGRKEKKEDETTGEIMPVLVLPASRLSE
jgi:hypothetical protein